MRGPLILLSTAVLALGPAVAARAGFAGARPFDFLALDYGAKQAALGGAFAAGRDDANALAYNPAGLAALSSHHASFMHASHFEQVARQRFAFAFRPGWAASADFLRYGEISRTTLSNPGGAGAQGFAPSAMVVTAGAGFPLSQRWSVGAAVKHIRQTLDDRTGRAWAADGGVQGVLLDEPALIAGAALSNYGTKTRFQSDSEDLPRGARAGAALGLASMGLPLALSFDLEQPEGRDMILHLGAEASILDSLALRFGYDSRNDAGTGVAFGLGLSYSDYLFDYAVVPFGELGASHRIAVGARWGR